MVVVYMYIVRTIKVRTSAASKRKITSGKEALTPGVYKEINKQLDSMNWNFAVTNADETRLVKTGQLTSKAEEKMAASLRSLEKAGKQMSDLGVYFLHNYAHAYILVGTCIQLCIDICVCVYTYMLCYTRDARLWACTYSIHRILTNNKHSIHAL